MGDDVDTRQFAEVDIQVAVEGYMTATEVRFDDAVLSSRRELFRGNDLRCGLSAGRAAHAVAELNHQFVAYELLADGNAFNLCSERRESLHDFVGAVSHRFQLLCNEIQTLPVRSQLFAGRQVRLREEAFRLSAELRRDFVLGTMQLSQCRRQRYKQILHFGWKRPAFVLRVGRVGPRLVCKILLSACNAVDGGACLGGTVQRSGNVNQSTKDRHAQQAGQQLSQVSACVTFCRCGL
ncbi:hypothetical protein GCM10027093_69900 [Paraburkholderia jirisanensis]